MWPKVAVVGAGILGASFSVALARRGAEVRIMESAAAPAAGATGTSWAWLNANMKHPPYYKELNVQGMEEWKQYDDLVHWCGTLMLNDNRTTSEPGYDSVPLSSQEVREAEPALAADVACVSARLYPMEGWVDPRSATLRFLEEAAQKGADLRLGEQVVDFMRDDGGGVTGVLTLSGDSCPADYVVLAAGTGTPHLAALLGADIPLLHKPAVVVITTPLPPLLKHMVVGETVFVLQREDGRLLLGETQPTESSCMDTSPEAAKKLLEQVAIMLPAAKAAGVDEIKLGFRPYPKDGHPILGFLPTHHNVYVAVTHSGLTLGPLLGTLGAREVLVGPLPHLAPYRPDRDFELNKKAYG